MSWRAHLRQAVRLGVLVPAASLTIPVPAYGQAAAISRPMVVPDEEWIERQCRGLAARESTHDAEERALERAKEACDVFEASATDRPARDAWVRTMLAIQNDVGPGAMRAFVPVFGEVLPAGLETYSLFLLPDPRWRSSDLATERAALWESFFSFGRSIGDDHAAIWFLDQEDNADVERSQEYCDQFGLSYNDGPYVVVTRKRPDLVDVDDEILVVRMGGIGPDGVQAVLNRLAQDLRRGEHDPGGLVYEEIKQRLLTRVRSYPEAVRAFASVVLGR